MERAMRIMEIMEAGIVLLVKLVNCKKRKNIRS